VDRHAAAGTVASNGLGGPMLLLEMIGLGLVTFALLYGFVELCDRV
jgi:hypothetical protein